MARLIRLLTTAALLLSVGLPAAAHEAAEPGSCRQIRGAATPDDPTDDVHVCRQDVWFHANQPQLGNTGAANGAFPTFNATKPTASVATGAGGGYLASSPTHQSGTPWDDRLTATFDGSFTGDIDNLAVTAYLFTPPAEEAQGIPTIAINTRLLVDDQPIFEAGGSEVKRSPAGTALTPQAEWYRIDFAAVNLYDAMKEAGLDGHDRQHTIRFQVMGTGIASEGAFFVYDTSEVPSGMTFNLEPDNLSTFTIVNA